MWVTIAERRSLRLSGVAQENQRGNGKETFFFQGQQGGRVVLVTRQSPFSSDSGVPDCMNIFDFSTFRLEASSFKLHVLNLSFVLCVVTAPSYLQSPPTNGHQQRVFGVFGY